jgi:hypothetical protein
MRYRYLILILLLVVPNFVQACSEQGYTVVFVNGVLNTLEKADTSRRELKIKLGEEFNGEPVYVRLGYNSSHLAGAGDLLQAAVQGFGTSVTNYDRDTILMQIYPELTTRKVLLVGHSQGTFYTNNLYDYLVNNGEPKASIGVYNVATPANYVAGGGLYLTSEFDLMIKAYADGAAKVGGVPPLRPNITLYGGDALGHSFVETYLAEASDRIVSDVSGGLARLTAEDASDSLGCFTPPEQGLGYNTQSVLFAVADPVAAGLKTGAVATYQGAVAVKDGVVWGIGAIGSAAQKLNPFAWGEPRSENLPGSYSVVKSLYGSSLDEGDLHELLGASVITAIPSAPPKKSALPPKPEPVVAPTTVSDASSEGVVAGAETELPPPVPMAPLIPSPDLVELSSPGYGGGGGGSSAPLAVSEPEVTSTATATSTDTGGNATSTDSGSTEASSTVPAYTVLYSQASADTLGDVPGVHAAGSLAFQTLGTGLEGVAGSVLYKVHGTALADKLTQGLGEVILFACPSSNYSSCISSASSDFHPVLTAAAGDDAYVTVPLVGYDANPYAFDPALYYMLEFITYDDMALWGSAADAYAFGETRWTNGTDITGDSQIADVAFRICSSSACGDSL